MNPVNKSYFKVGVFVLSTFFLFLLFLIVFTSGILFQKPLVFETYFDESVQGLDIGSAVKHRGVKVGSVETITFVQNGYGNKLRDDQIDRYGRLVMIRMSVPDFIKGVSGSDFQKSIQRMIRNGLRVRLASQGLTGTAYLEVDYLDPEKNPPMEIHWQPKNIYVPSAPSTISRFTASVDRFFDKIDKADVSHILSNVDLLISNLNAKVEEIRIAELSKEAIFLLAELRKTNGEIKSFVSQNEFQNTPKKLDQTINQLQTTIKRLDSVVATNQGDWNTTVENLRKASEDLKEVTANAKKYPSLFIIGEPPNQSKIWK